MKLSVASRGGDEGRAWLIVGADSGFEGLTSLYYTGINYKLTAAELPGTGGYNPPTWTLLLAAGLATSATALGLGLIFRARRITRRKTGATP